MVSGETVGAAAEAVGTAGGASSVLLAAAVDIVEEDRESRRGKRDKRREDSNDALIAFQGNAGSSCVFVGVSVWLTVDPRGSFAHGSKDRRPFFSKAPLSSSPLSKRPTNASV